MPVRQVVDNSFSCLNLVPHSTRTGDGNKKIGINGRYDFGRSFARVVPANNDESSNISPMLVNMNAAKIPEGKQKQFILAKARETSNHSIQFIYSLTLIFKYNVSHDYTLKLIFFFSLHDLVFFFLLIGYYAF